MSFDFDEYYDKLTQPELEALLTDTTVMTAVTAARRIQALAEIAPEEEKTGLNRAVVELTMLALQLKSSPFSLNRA